MKLMCRHTKEAWPLVMGRRYFITFPMVWPSQPYLELHYLHEISFSARVRKLMGTLLFKTITNAFRTLLFVILM
jgi:hypothetical protein